MLLNILFCIFAYFMGNILGGKIVGKIFNEDISQIGSGNIGARNAGRILGGKAFLLVLTIDFFKGFFVIIVAKLMNFSMLIITVATLLVILGHIKPLLNKFNGGKGVATFIGAISALSPNLVFILILGFLLISFITRSTTIGFYSTLPVLIYIFYLDFRSLTVAIVFILIISLLILISNKDIENSFNKYFSSIRMNKKKILNK